MDTTEETMTILPRGWYENTLPRETRVLLIRTGAVSMRDAWERLAPGIAVGVMLGSTGIHVLRALGVC